MKHKILTIFSLFLFFECNLFAENSLEKKDTTSTTNNKPKRIYTTTRLTTDQPEIDGNLNDECWKTGEWAGDFIQWIPNEGANATYPTYLKILYDDNNIYVAIRAYDYEPEKISFKAGRRDEFNGDCAGITFDSYHDHRTGFEFDVSASGQKTDLVLTNPSNADLDWNAVWYVKTGLEDSAWTAEFKIPLSQLRYSNDYEQVWGLHCWRWIDRLQEESDWEPQSSQGPGIVYLFGDLHGIKGLPVSRRVEIMPYSLGKLNTYKSEPGNPFADNGRTWLGNFGVDAKIGLSNNFTADITINPDFGQVESDPSEMNLTAFETFFAEKRPFFLEGKNIFSFDFDNSSLFYSRRIGHAPGYTPDLKDNEYMDAPDNTTILGALKLSGKTAGGLSVGVLQTLTSKEIARINSNGADKDVNVEPLTNYSIVRIQQDFGQGNTIIGGILTSTNRFIKDSQLEFMDRNAFTGGIDFLHHWNDKEYYVSARLVGSSVSGTTDAMKELQNSSARYYQRPDADYFDFDSARTSLSGHGGRIKAGKVSKGRWRYSAELNWRSPGLELNDLGYMPTADIFKQTSFLSYSVNQPVGIFRTYSIELEQVNNWDFGMNYLSSGGEAEVYLEFLNKWAVRTSLEYTSEALDNRILRGGNAMLVPAVWNYDFYGRTDPSKKFSFDVNSDIIKSEDNSSEYYSVQPGITFMPLDILRFSMSVDYSSNIDKLQYIDTKTVNNVNRYILGKINQHTLGMTFRIDYNISPEFSVQYYGSPFASAGKYSEYKVVTNPRAADYNERVTYINPVLNGNDFEVIEDDNNKTSYSFENPDFNFSQFRSNLVLRWEYKPGSQLFLVWSNERTYDVRPGRKNINDVMSILKDVYPNNIFLLKFNYWFTI